MLDARGRVAAHSTQTAARQLLSMADFQEFISFLMCAARRRAVALERWRFFAARPLISWEPWVLDALPARWPRGRVNRPRAGMTEPQDAVALGCRPSGDAQTRASPNNGDVSFRQMLLGLVAASSSCSARGCGIPFDLTSG